MIQNYNKRPTSLTLLNTNLFNLAPADISVVAIFIGWLSLPRNYRTWPGLPRLISLLSLLSFSG